MFRYPESPSGFNIICNARLLVLEAVRRLWLNALLLEHSGNPKYFLHENFAIQSKLRWNLHCSYINLVELTVYCYNDGTNLFWIFCPSLWFSSGKNVRYLFWVVLMRANRYLYPEYVRWKGSGRLWTAYYKWASRPSLENRVRSVGVPQHSADLLLRHSPLQLPLALLFFHLPVQCNLPRILTQQPLQSKGSRTAERSTRIMQIYWPPMSGM